MNDVFSKVFLDPQNQRVFLTYVTAFNFWFSVFDKNLKLILSINTLHTKEIRNIIITDTNVYTYDELNLFVLDKSSLSLLLTIQSLNPKITSVIISQQLQFAFIWNNNYVDKIQNSNIAIYSLVNAELVFMIQSTQQIENGYIN